MSITAVKPMTMVAGPAVTDYVDGSKVITCRVYQQVP